LQALAELGRLGLELFVRERLEERLELADVGDTLEVPLDLARVGIA